MAGDETPSVRLSQLEQELDGSRKELEKRIKHYEAKLATLTVINGALQQENDQLKEELETFPSHGGHSGESRAEQELAELQEEFTKRLGVAEKTAASMKEQVFGLRDEVKAANARAADAERRVAERDATIKQLQGEGVDLSKKIGDLEGFLRKLRADQSSWESERERLNARLQVMEASARSEELNRSADVEGLRHDVEAAKQANAELREFYTKALADAQLHEKQELDRVRKQVAAQKAASEGLLAEQEASYAMTIASLRESLANVHEEASRREDVSRKELRDLESRCRAAEAAQEEAAARLTESTRPLVRQMESLSLQLKQREQDAKEHEHHLQEQLSKAEATAREATEERKRAEGLAGAAERRVQVAEKAAAAARAENRETLAKMKSLEEKVQTWRTECESALERARRADQERDEALGALAVARLAKEEAEKREKTARLESRLEFEEERKTLEAEKAAWNEHRRRGFPPQGDASVSRQGSSNNFNGIAMDEPPSPTSSTNSDYTSEGFGSPNPGLTKQGSGRFADGLDALGRNLTGRNAAMSERLIAKIRQLQGEMAQLQREVQAMRTARERESEELVKTLARANSLQQDAKDAPLLRKEYAELKKRHDMALVMLGERNERAEQLEEDMNDVKALYREQITLLVSQIDPAKWPNGYRICLFCSHCAQIHKRKS